VPARAVDLVAVTQTPFQRNLWAVARDAHAAGDRADARIMMKMIEAIDDGDYEQLAQLNLALRPRYRERSGKVPQRRAQDVDASHR
jgi:hypothetical protein